ncbi:MAG: FAD-binding oxidoreductase, partial [Gammaproteobacteria bacterium]
MLTDSRTLAAYAEGAGIYRIIPESVAIPTNTHDVVDLVRRAMQRGTPLIPRGAGSGMPGGNVGRGMILDLSRGFQTLEIDPQRRR